MAQVNAWGNYEQATSKNARRITSTSSHGRSHAERRAYEDIEFGTSRHARSWHGLTDSYNGKRRIYVNQNDSYHGSALSQHSAPIRLTNSAHSRHFYPIEIVEQADSRDETTVINEELLELTPRQRVLLRELFFPFSEVHLNENTASSANKRGPSSLCFGVKQVLSKVNATMPNSQDFIKKSTTTHTSGLFLLLEFCLRGIAQVYFQNNPVSGLIILIGMYLENPRIATHGLIGVIIGNLTAVALGFDKGLMYSGLFGYNAFLVGLALATFQNSPKWDFKISIAVIFFSAFSSIIFVCLGKLLGPYKVPPLTLPFNIATLMMLASRIVIGPLLGSPTVRAENSFISFLIGTLRGVGQVFLASDLYASALVLVGIMICSRISAAAALFGSALGTAVALLTNSNVAAAEFGLFGFNSSLSVTAMLMFYTPSCGAIFIAVLNGIITVSVQQALMTVFEPYGLPVMTLPFCLASLPFLFIQGATSRVISVPLASMTVPEDHVKRIKVIKEGFYLLQEAIATGEEKEKTSMLLKTGKEDRENPMNLHNASFLFHTLVDEKKAETYTLNLAKLKHALLSMGFHGIDSFLFITETWRLHSKDRSDFMNKDQFVDYISAMHGLKVIHDKVTEFFNFADESGIKMINFSDFDEALKCLDLPSLDKDERVSVMDIVQINDPMLKFHYHDLIHFVLMAKLKLDLSDGK